MGACPRPDPWPRSWRASPHIVQGTCLRPESPGPPYLRRAPTRPRSPSPTGRLGLDLPRPARRERTARLDSAAPGPWAGEAMPQKTPSSEGVPALLCIQASQGGWPTTTRRRTTFHPSSPATHPGRPGEGAAVSRAGPLGPRRYLSTVNSVTVNVPSVMRAAFK